MCEGKVSRGTLHEKCTGKYGVDGVEWISTKYEVTKNALVLSIKVIPVNTQTDDFRGVN